jgi:hypothetical protein
MRWVGVSAVGVLTLLAMAFVGAASSVPQSVYAFGGAPFYGSTGLVPLNQPITAMAARPDGTGYWTVTKSGEVSPFGAAGFYGSITSTALARPIVGITSTASGNGYLLVANDGGVFAFGDALFTGSLAGSVGTKDVVGIAANPTGTGYWVVTRTGKVVNFGDAPYLGSSDTLALNGPIVGIAAAPSGNGYWLAARDGGVFTFGAAAFHGSMGDSKLERAVVGISPTGSGYLLASSEGGVYAFGDAAYSGSLAFLDVPQPTVAVVAHHGGGYWLALSGHLAKASSPRPEPSYLPADTVVLGDTATMPAASYRQLHASASCTVQILDKDGVARLLGGPGRNVIRIRPTDTSFESQHCGAWTTDLFPATPTLDSPVGDGTWLLGIDIESGTWTASGGSGCQWKTQADLAGLSSSVLASGNTPTVTLHGDEVGFTSVGCGTWSHS